MNLSLIIVSILPVILLLAYIYRKDKNEKEPLGLLVKSFFAGCLVALAVIFLFVFLDSLGISTEFENPIAKAFFNAAIPEEGLKFLFLYLIVWKNKHFNEFFDGIVYAAFISLGFACLENILYVAQGGMSVGIMRAFISVPAHFFFAIFMGFYLSKAKFDKKARGYYIFLSLGVPILFHGIFDAILMSAEVNEILASVLMILFFIFDFFLFRFAIRRINRYCHICGKLIPKNSVNCPTCQYYLDSYKEMQENEKQEN